jgi:hypothetical protein
MTMAGTIRTAGKSGIWRLGGVIILAAVTITVLRWLPSDRLHSSGSLRASQMSVGPAGANARITPSPDDASAKKSVGATRPAPTPHSADLYQRMLDQFNANPASARMAAALTQAHEKVADAQDDPEWARPMERHMLEAFWADPAASRLEIRDISCRRTGCEVQMFETMASSSTGELPAWFQAVDRIRQSDLGGSIEMAANFGTRYDDRVMYVTTFNRKPALSGASQ